MVAKKKPIAKKKTTTKRRKPSVVKNPDFHPNEAILAVASGAAVLLVALALITGV